MSLTRREICRLIPAAMAAGNAIPAFAIQDDSLPSATFPFESMPVQDFDHARMRKIMKGKLATGEHIEAHETTLPPNGYPHPPHRHLHSEMWLIREGTVELTINGASHRLGPGGLGFVHLNEEHGIKNVGTGPAILCCRHRSRGGHLIMIWYIVLRQLGCHDQMQPADCLADSIAWGYS
jgi:quercetin dioxygenase-like cupin family protein